MSKLMGALIGFIDNFMPGYKTYFCWVIGLGMAVCQAGGWHIFTTESWAVVGITGMGMWKMSLDRNKK